MFDEMILSPYNKEFIFGDWIQIDFGREVYIDYLLLMGGQNGLNETYTEYYQYAPGTYYIVGSKNEQDW